ncbi:MAG: nitrogen fixation protein NifH [Chloroflexi bacterium]|nr:nitrogen fixation protein NifH [Chloroflexota bacterium]
MSWQTQLRGDSVSWLLETENPGVRYLAMRDLLELPDDDAEMKSARKKAHKEGPIADVLSHMEKEGYWVKTGPGYNPKYRSTVWSIILLAQLGALANEDKRIDQGCKYLLDHLAEGGQFTAITSGAPSGAIDCLQGNLCWALMEMGYDDPRLKKAYEWMARTVTGDGIAPMEDKDAPVRYYAYKCGPNFACGVNDKLPCAWGAVKVMLAFGKWPVARRSPLIKKAIKQGADFFFSIDPATAKYPTRDKSGKPSRDWWKFGFPVFYITDLLQLAEALVSLGYGDDPRLGNTLNIIREKQNARGQWPMEFDYTGKTWIDFGKKKQPNKWVTLRALRVLKAIA